MGPNRLLPSAQVEPLARPEAATIWATEAPRDAPPAPLIGWDATRDRQDQSAALGWKADQLRRPARASVHDSLDRLRPCTARVAGDPRSAAGRIHQDYAEST